jgi:hypothetical protein
VATLQSLWGSSAADSTVATAMQELLEEQPHLLVEGQEHSIDLPLYKFLFPDYRVSCGNNGSCGDIIRVMRAMKDFVNVCRACLLVRWDWWTAIVAAPRSERNF